MNKIHQRRIFFICLFAISASLATSLILYSLKNNINVYLSPSEVPTISSKEYRFRLGGMVKPGSTHHDKNGLGVSFIVTDFKKELSVYYQGILPDLFREGKGVIADGKLTAKGNFVASAVLAKHDENYMPKQRGTLS